MTDYFKPRERDILFRRIEGITPDVRSSDGKVTGHQLLGHFNNSLREICGLQRPKRPGNIFERTIGKWLVFHLIPWPESAPKTESQLAEFVGQEKLAAFTNDHATFVSLLQTFESQSSNQTLGPHPIFGRLTRDEWGKVMFLHLDYHLTMFDIHGDFYARK